MEVQVGKAVAVARRREKVRIDVALARALILGNEGMLLSRSGLSIWVAVAWERGRGWS